MVSSSYRSGIITLATSAPPQVRGGVTTAVSWVGIGEAFGEPYMEAIMSCGVPRTLNTIWYTTSKLKTGGAAASQELSVKEVNRYKESVSKGGLIPHKYLLCLI